MSDQSLDAAFHASRSRLHAIAFRMLGSRAEADDAVQDTWLRLSSADPERIDGLITAIEVTADVERIGSYDIAVLEP